jgi:signal transduction histidine kinase
VLVSTLLAICFVTIYFLYADFRQDEFFQRLRNKCNTTYKLLIEVEEIDHDLLQVIDLHTINALYDEKILIFDENNTIIYSSIDDRKITYSPSMLDQIRNEGEIIHEESGAEVFGMLIRERERHFVVLASAYDKYGWRKLHNLRDILSVTFLAALILIGLLSFVYVKEFLRPLELFSERVRRINENNLQERIEIQHHHDEMEVLASNFNQMLDRIDNSFAVLKSFVQNASHELRTPIASMIVQTESALSKELTPVEYKVMLQSLLDDQHELADLVNSLLLLSKFEQIKFSQEWKPMRVDEILFKSIEVIQPLFKDVVIKVDFAKIPDDSQDITISGNDVLLQSAFRNLIKNACQYTSDRQVSVIVDYNDMEVILQIRNVGPFIMDTELTHLFTPFFRGANAIHKKGFGLGLSISRRIIAIHYGTIRYVACNDTNQFTVVLPRNLSQI